MSNITDFEVAPVVIFDIYLSRHPEHQKKLKLAFDALRFASNKVNAGLGILLDVSPSSIPTECITICQKKKHPNFIML